MGWFTAKTGGTQVTTSTTVTSTSNHTIYAHWEAAKYKVQTSSATTYVDTLSAAFKTTGVRTITLLSNATETGTLYYEGSTAVTLNINGYTLNIDNAIMNFYASLTINGGGGKIVQTTQGSSSDRRPVVATNNVMTVSNVTLESYANTELAWQNPGATLTIASSVTFISHTGAANIQK